MAASGPASPSSVAGLSPRSLTALSPRSLTALSPRSHISTHLCQGRGGGFKLRPPKPSPALQTCLPLPFHWRALAHSHAAVALSPPPSAVLVADLYDHAHLQAEGRGFHRETAATAPAHGPADGANSPRHLGNACRSARTRAALLEPLHGRPPLSPRSSTIEEVVNQRRGVAHHSRAMRISLPDGSASMPAASCSETNRWHPCVAHTSGGHVGYLQQSPGHSPTEGPFGSLASPYDRDSTRTFRVSAPAVMHEIEHAHSALRATQQSQLIESFAQEMPASVTGRVMAMLLPRQPGMCF
ncbi:hypothetical protein AB1Y20_020407 [Prymnesium parvum]|uniref:Uncharacterized protein n=1 Tax=Prymnesium parvum TaxID=97485 RepID=A0AB34JXB1_PRYPA